MSLVGQSEQTLDAPAATCAGSRALSRAMSRRTALSVTETRLSHSATDLFHVA